MQTFLNPPPPTKFNFLSLGAGVQSSCLALMAATGEIGPKPDAAIFADTQAEPASVYKWLDWLEAEIARSPYPFPVHRVSAGDLEKREVSLHLSKKSGKVYRKSSIPAFIEGGGSGLLWRKCTADFKVVPLLKKQRELAGIGRAPKQVSVTSWIGISWDEIQRIKDSREPWVQHRWPLIEHQMTRRHCIEWMESRGYPKPPRSACVFCPYHSNREWRRLRDEEPDEFARAIVFEKRLHAANAKDQTAKGVPYLHPARKPLSEVNLEDEDPNQLHLFENNIQNECEGMCGV